MAKPTVTLSSGHYYQIKVQGKLDECWRTRLNVLTLTTADGKTTLTSWMQDQAALHGFLIRIRDLGLPLLLVKVVIAEDGKETK